MRRHRVVSRCRCMQMFSKTCKATSKLDTRLNYHLLGLRDLSDEIAHLRQGATDRTGGIFSQQQSDTAFRFPQSGKGCLMVSSKSVKKKWVSNHTIWRNIVRRTLSWCNCLVNIPPVQTYSYRSNIFNFSESFSVEVFSAHEWTNCLMFGVSANIQQFYR